MKISRLPCALRLALLAAIVAFTSAPRSEAAAVEASFPVTIEVDAAKYVGDMKPIWRFFGADEPNYATMKDGKRLLSELGDLRPGEIYFRTHNLLSTGDGTPALKWGSTNIYTEDANGRPVYDWTIVDRIFDGYLARGVRPYAQIGFMPAALSTHPEPYQHVWRPGMNYLSLGTGWSYPPKDYQKWAELVYQWVRHCVTRYGQAEVNKWYWEVWNEANYPAYWQGSADEFYKLHDYAIDAIRRALPSARVGGPEMAGSGGKFMEGFLQHCVNGINAANGKKGTPTDFISFHAKGQPLFVDGHVRLGISAQLATVDEGFGMIAAVPELRGTPIVLGEADPDGCAACQGPQLGYRTGTMYSSYTAASLAREYQLADKHGVNLEGALTWAFEFEDQPYFAGQRVLATNGIDLPVLNVFRMLSRMGGRRVAAKSTHEVPLDVIEREGVRDAPDVAALTSWDGKTVSVLVWHYHDDDLPGPDAAVSLQIKHLPRSARSAAVTHYRIDQSHSNAFARWRQLGSPTAVGESQYAQLQTAGRLETLNEKPAHADIVSGTMTLTFSLPRQAVSLLVLETGR
jgi:xylan 1,4-beta-xylosidase